jgi:negative regulator of flagellin synthesis FlgM
MDIRNSLEGLKSLLGTSQAAPAATPQTKSSASTSAGGLGSDRATFSSAGSEVAQAAADSGVRMDKVASIQAALAAGTYSAPASAVASKLVTSMLSGEQ